VTHIPLVDLKAQHRQIADEVLAGFARVCDATAFILGEDVEAFERRFADFCGVRHCVGVANGTDALELALRAVGLGAGDEVILPANTFVATAEAVVRAGATPVLVDCEPRYHLIDVAQVADRIGPRTKAVMPVHLYGQIAPMEQLAEVLAGSDVVLIEDAAQAQGAKRHGRLAGSFGIAAGTSFYPGKNLGAYGDAGAVVTDSDEVAQHLRALRNHGGRAKYEHATIGVNSRLDTLQAVVLNAKLPLLDGWNAARRRAAAGYDELLTDLPGVRLPATLPGNLHAWHLYVVRVPHRDEVLGKLSAAGVGAGIHYPTPVHLTEAFSWLGHARGDFPVAEQAAGEILSLPLFAEITARQQEHVADELWKALAA
jgi:dTDP-4-amino-4,6-dideoxygalactose transaminase